MHTACSSGPGHLRAAWALPANLRCLAVIKMHRTAHIGHKAVGAQPPVVHRCQLLRRPGICNRQQRLCVTASGSNGGNSRVIRGKCYITRDVRGSCLFLAYFAHDYKESCH